MKDERSIANKLMLEINGISTDAETRNQIQSIVEELTIPLQARVKDQAETILVQRAVYETLSAKVKKLEAEVFEWQSMEHNTEILRLRSELSEAHSHEQSAASAYARAMKVVDAAREMIAISDRQTVMGQYDSVPLRRALREMDGEKDIRAMELFDESIKHNSPTQCHLCGATPDNDNNCECN